MEKCGYRYKGEPGAVCRDCGYCNPRVPPIFTADRGNLEGVIALILGTGLVLFVMGRYYGAAVFIGLAASIKPFPGLFLLLLLRKKLYREFAVGVTAMVCTTLLALTALGPNPIAAYRGCSRVCSVTITTTS